MPHAAWLRTFHAMNGRALGWLGLLCCLTGCGGNAVCRGNCPDIAGSYQLSLSQPGSACNFAPYLVGPVLQLRQSATGEQVETALIDPVNNLQVPLTGQVYEANSDGATGFVMRSEVSRQASDADPGVRRLWLELTGTVQEKSGTRFLNAQFTQEDLSPDGGCTTTQVFTGNTGSGT